MKLLEKLKALFGKKPAAPVPAPQSESAGPKKVKRVCKGCGKSFPVNPAWEHIPNYCKDCKQRFAREKEEKQRTGAPRKIKRTCKSCGRIFTFPNTLEHYPNYCLNCRKTRQTQMKAKYGAPVKRARSEKSRKA